MPTIELIYDNECPNVEATRETLHAALSAMGTAPTWREWNRSDTSAPEYVRAYGSPTILIDGQDIAGMPPADAPACRLYRNEKGRARGVPDSRLILAALQTRPAR